MIKRHGINWIFWLFLRPKTKVNDLNPRTKTVMVLSIIAIVVALAVSLTVATHHNMYIFFCNAFLF